MIVRIERVVPFPRDAVYAWWTDFRQDDHASHDSPASSRRDIVRREGNEVWLRERARRPVPITLVEHVTLEPPSGYAVDAHYPGVDARYAYRFEAIGETTRVCLTANLTPHHAARLLVLLFRRAIVRYAERDTDFHIRRMAEDLGPKRG